MSIGHFGAYPVTWPGFEFILGATYINLVAYFSILFKAPFRDEWTNKVLLIMKNVRISIFGYC